MKQFINLKKAKTVREVLDYLKSLSYEEIQKLEKNWSLNIGCVGHDPNNYKGLDDVIIHERTEDGIKFSGIIFDYEPETVVNGILSWDGELVFDKNLPIMKGYQFLGLIGVGYGQGNIPLFYHP